MNFISKFAQSAMWLCSINFLLVSGSIAAEPTYEQGKNIFIETGVEAPDRNPTWYASMVAKPYAPVFEMLATIAVLATWKQGINNIPGEPVMLPGTITWKPKVTLKDVEDLKAIVKKAGGNPTPHQVDLMRHQQWLHINDILDHPLEESYQAQVIENFKWEDWIDSEKTITKTHARSDTRLKNYAYRSKPIESSTEGAGH